MLILKEEMKRAKDFSSIVFYLYFLCGGEEINLFIIRVGERRKRQRNS